VESSFASNAVFYVLRAEFQFRRPDTQMNDSLSGEYTAQTSRRLTTPATPGLVEWSVDSAVDPGWSPTDQSGLDAKDARPPK